MRAEQLGAKVQETACSRADRLAVPLAASWAGETAVQKVDARVACLVDSLAACWGVQSVAS